MVLFRIIKKFKILMNAHQKMRIIELGILMIISGFLEMISVSLMLPFVEAAVFPEQIMNKEIVVKICDLFGIQSHTTFLVLLSIIMAILYIFKNVFLLFQMMVQNRFANNQMFLMQYSLLESYLSRPYEDFLSIKTGDVLQVICTDTSRAYSILSQLLTLIAELVVSATLLITVFVVSPVITLSMAAILLCLTGLLLYIIRPIMKDAGDTYRRSNAGMNQWLMQSVQGIKEIKLMRKEKYFKQQFSVHGKKYVKAKYTDVTLGNVPRFMIEAIAMSTFFLIVGMMIYRGMEMEKVIPVISIVAMASIRLLPAMNRISVNLAALSFGEPAVDTLIENLRSIQQSEAENNQDLRDNKASGSIKCIDKSVVMSHVRYAYPSSDQYIFDDANLTISKGRSVGVVGASGSGKTTLIDILLGLLNPQSGIVSVDGFNIRDDLDGWVSQIGYIPQTIFMLDGTLRSNIAFGEEEDNIDDEKIWAALKEASLEEFVKNLPDGLDTEIGERGMRLSGGQRQRIGIARALYLDPEILVFDEATSALDNDTEAAIMESINHLQGSKTMIIIAHRLSTIENCDEIYRVESGRIIKEK